MKLPEWFYNHFTDLSYL